MGSEKIIFNQGQLNYIESHWKTLDYKIRNNKFWNNIYRLSLFNQELTIKQWDEFKFLLKNGKSRYNSGILPKNY